LIPGKILWLLLEKSSIPSLEIILPTSVAKVFGFHKEHTELADRGRGVVKLLNVVCRFMNYIKILMTWCPIWTTWPTKN